MNEVKKEPQLSFSTDRDSKELYAYWTIDSGQVSLVINLAHLDMYWMKYTQKTGWVKDIEGTVLLPTKLRNTLKELGVNPKEKAINGILKTLNRINDPSTPNHINRIDPKTTKSG